MKRKKILLSYEFQNWVDLVLIDQDIHGANSNKWIFYLMGKKLHIEDGLMKIILFKSMILLRKYKGTIL